MMTWIFSDQTSSNEIWKDIHVDSIESNFYKNTGDGKMLYVITVCSAVSSLTANCVVTLRDIQCRIIYIRITRGSVQKTRSVSGNEFSDNFIIKYPNSLLVFSL
jgi:hypothetical protein